jgi:hypothetical protein
MLLARAGAYIQGEGRHNILVQLETASQLVGEGAEREGRERVQSGLRGGGGKLKGMLFRSSQSCVQNFSQKTWKEETAWEV